MHTNGQNIPEYNDDILTFFIDEENHVIVDLFGRFNVEDDLQDLTDPEYTCLAEWIDAMDDPTQPSLNHEPISVDKSPQSQIKDKFCTKISRHLNTG